MRFSICNIEPEGYKYSHFLYDICKYLCYGIESAGHECCIIRNNLYSDRINIVMGAHNLDSPAMADQIRHSGRYILLQSEIISGDSVNNSPVQKTFKEIYLPIMRDAIAVWTGVESNINQLKRLDIDAELIRMGYHPLMEEVRHKRNKDIDFLFCGSVTPHRGKLIQTLTARGGKVVTIFDDAAMYRNDLIARTRVNLAPNQGPGMNHFGGSRVLYLINNRSIVVVERCHDQGMYEHCFPSADTDKWADLCMETLHRPDLTQISEEYYERFKKIRMADLIQPLIEKLRIDDKKVSHSETLVKAKPQERDDSVVGKEAPLLPHIKHNNIIQGMTSIIIRTSHHLENTKKCVKSIRQHTPEPHEVIFIVPRSSSPVLKWVKKLVQKHHNYTFIEYSVAPGFSREVNQGIQASSGEFVLLLDDNVRVTEGWLTGMLECLQTSSTTGVIGPVTNSIINPQGIGSREFRPGADLDEYAAAFHLRNRHRRISKRKIAGICMLFRYTLVEKIGLFDEDLRSCMFGDEDFCLRDALDGYHNLIAGDVFVHYPAFGDYCRDLYNSKKLFDEKWRAISTATTRGKNIVTLQTIETAAGWYHQKQQIDKTIAALVEGVKYAPDDPRLYQSLALMLIDARLFQDALAALNAMPEHARQEAKSLELFGFCFEGLGRIDEANAHADRLLAIEPLSAPALNLKGMLAYKHGDRAAAERFFQQASESDPGYGEPFTNLGVMQWADSKQEEALDLLEQGFLLSPTITDSVTLYHNALTSLEAFARAEPIFREAKVLHPKNKRVFFLFIDLLLQQGKYIDAMQEVEEALLVFDIDDGLIPAALQIREKIGVQQLPAPPLKRRGTLSLCMIVKNEEANLAKCLMSVKDIADEMIVVDTGSTDKTRDIATAFGAQVFDFLWTDDFSEARNVSLSKASGDWILVLDGDEVLSPADHAALAKIVHSKPGKPVAYSIVTRNYTNLVSAQGWTANDGSYTREETGTGWHPSAKVRLFSNDKCIQFRNAVHEVVEPSLLEAGISIKPCRIPVHHYGKMNADKIAAKGEDYYLLGRKKLEETGGNAYAIQELAIQASELERYSESVELWQKLIDLQPHNALAYFNMGYAHLKLKQYEETIRVSKKALELNPELKEAVLNYASSELVIGDIDKALTSLRNVLERVPDYPPALGLLAAVLSVKGEREKAFEGFKKLSKMGYDCVEFLYDLADELASEGRYKEAVQLLEAAIESNNTHKDTQALLDRCREMIQSDNHKQTENRVLQ